MRTYEVTMRVIRYEKVLVEVESPEEMTKEAHAKTVLGDMERAEVFHAVDLTPKPRSVKERINAAFKALRKEGFIARMNYLCCQSCAWAALETEYNATEDSNVVFYHHQDAEAFDGKHLSNYYAWENGERVTKTSRLYLAHQGESHRIVEALKEQGLTYEWDGTHNTRIAVTGVEEGTL